MRESPENDMQIGLRSTFIRSNIIQRIANTLIQYAIICGIVIDTKNRPPLSRMIYRVGLCTVKSIKVYHLTYCLYLHSLWNIWAWVQIWWRGRPIFFQMKLYDMWQCWLTIPLTNLIRKLSPGLIAGHWFIGDCDMYSIIYQIIS